MRFLVRLLPMIAVTLLGAGCATVNGPVDERDPWEGFNRSIYKFNDAVDKAVLTPVAEAYQDVVPDPVDKGITNFFGNLGDVGVLLNDLLQLKLEQAASDFSRITFNTTFGLLGLFDVATPMGLPKHDEDFGQTLGYWGVGSGPYLVLPILGPSTLRDGLARPVDYIASPQQYAVSDTGAEWALAGVNAVDTRADLLGASRLIEQAALDPYVFMRDAYLQRRASQVQDGAVTEEFDPLDDDFFDEIDEETEATSEPDEPDAASESAGPKNEAQESGEAEQEQVLETEPGDESPEVMEEPAQ